MKLKITILIVTSIINSAFNFEFASLEVAADTLTINSIAQYTFNFKRDQDDNFQTTAYSTNPIASSDTITVTFPNTYSLTTVSCLVTVDTGAEISPSSCTVTGNQVTAAGIVNTDTFIATVIFKIGNVVNPSPAILTDYFTGTIGSDTSGAGVFHSQVQL